MATKYLSGSEVLAFRDQAFVEYFSNPAYITKIQEKFGERIVEVIEDMLNRKLERRHLVKEI
ncbi:MAG: hypothetical protein KKH04_03545 [Proteobacteria bacterium]|nr:hypothetical protein [Pseudomonadota bacterium]